MSLKARREIFMLLGLFILTAILLSGILGVLAYSVMRPSKRIWPPPAQQAWQYYVVWLLTLLSFGGLMRLACSIGTASAGLLPFAGRSAWR